MAQANDKTLPWRQEIAGTAIVEMNRAKLRVYDRKIPLSVFLNFSFALPKTVKSEHKTTKPDIDKLIRACLDALTGTVFTDDSQVVSVRAEKHYATPECVYISICEVGQ